MNERLLRALLVEDNEDDAVLTLRELVDAGYELVWTRVDTRHAMDAALSERPWDIVLSDYSMPTFSAPEAFQLLRERGLDLPFVIVSGTVGEAAAVEAMRAGVHDYVLKDALVRLVPTVERALREAAERAERRRMEERLALADRMLQQAQKMEAIGRLAAGVAHDFNNILSVILSYSDMLIADQVPPERVKSDIEEIHEAALRAADLTRQLLAFSRKQVLAPRILDLNESVASLDHMIRRLIGDRVVLTTITRPEVGRVLADPGQVEQVIVNLVVNARDAMPDGGKLTIETANVDLDEVYAATHPDVKPGPYAMLAVTDTGIGMSSETQARVFEPFFTTKEKGKGTGLGLATVFGVVRQSGGTIWLYSELGHGTTFKIYLPRTEGDVVDHPRSAPPGAGGHETVLVVENDPKVRKVVVGILRRLGYHVIAADSPTHAVDLCMSPEAIHLVVSDVMMPDAKGPELVTQLVSLRPSLKALFISGYTDNSVVAHGVLAADAHFLQKPITPDALARKVRQVLDA